MSDILHKATVGAIGVGLAAALSMAAPASAGTVPESTDPIKIAINEWTGQHITAHVAGEILKRMGYNVEYVTAGYYPQLTAMEDNSVTAALEIWSSNIGEGYDKALATGNVEEIGDLGLVPVEAWMYPAYVEEMCPGLPNWEALNACAEIFATPETFPKGRFLDYPADWGTTNVDRIAALGLNFVSVPAGSEGALVAEIKSAVARQEPLLIQFWKPHWVHANIDMKIDQPLETRVIDLIIAVERRYQSHQATCEHILSSPQMRRRCYCSCRVLARPVHTTYPYVGNNLDKCHNLLLFQQLG